MATTSTAAASIGAGFVLWPPPPVDEVDPFHFGVATGAKRPRGRTLNPYVPRDIDGAIVRALRSKRAVVVATPPGAGVARTAYEALNTAMPKASLLISRRPNEFDPTELRGIENSGDIILWIDDLAGHWGYSGHRLIDSLREWLTNQHRYLIASHYDDRSVPLLNHPDFRRMKLPVLALPAELSQDELSAEKAIYGVTATTALIGKNPPRGAMTADRFADFSRSVNGVAARYGVDTRMTSGAIAADLRNQHPNYAANRLGTIDIDPMRGESRPLGEWLNMIRGCYDPSALQSSKHQVVDGRLCILALIALDPAFANQISVPVLDLLAAECELRPQPPAAPVPPGSLPAREHVRLMADTPVGLDGDELGRRGVATALTDQLRTLVADHPGRSFLVHIDGAWGAGKSTLLGFVSDEINQARTDQDQISRDQIDQSEEPTAPASTRGAAPPTPWLVVPYDAWRQSKAGQPWLTLMHGVRAAVSSIQPRVWGKSWFSLRERARLINRWQWFALLLMAVTVAGIGLLVSGQGDVTISTWGDWAKIVGGLVPVIAAGWLIASAAGRFVLLDSRRSARAFFDARADPMEDLADHFDWLLRQADRPVMLLIDDLDRCAETFVVDLLDAIQKLMRDRDAHHPAGGGRAKAPSLLVVVAADGRWIRQSFDNAYASLAKAVDVPGATVGSLYLEKMFQLTVPVPRLSDELKSAYLRDLLAEPTTTRVHSRADPDLVKQLENAPHEELLDLLAAVPEVERIKVSHTAIQRLVVAPGAGDATRHALEPFAGLVATTPRAMKRFVMAYSMLRAVRTAEGSVVGLGPLALWTIVITRWPTLADYLQNSPESIRLFNVPANRIPTTTPDDLVPLFTDPPYELRQIMNHVDGPLDEATIRECSGQGRLKSAITSPS